VKVILQQNIYSEYPAEPGRWCMRTERELPAVPSEGDYVELTDGWSSVKVRSTTFMADGSVIVNLEPTKTDNPDSITAHHWLVDEYDWEWLGARPARSVDSL
jgi:hypothetical protein